MRRSGSRAVVGAWAGGFVLGGLARAQSELWSVDGAVAGEQFGARVAALRKLCREQRLLFTSVDTAADPTAALLRMFGR